MHQTLERSFSVKKLFLLVIPLCVLQSSDVVRSQEWFSVNSGGGRGSNSNLIVITTLGQPAVGKSSNGGQVMCTGFLTGLPLTGGPVSASPAESLPLRFELGQNYPNPFNPSTTIRYQLPSETHVTLKIFDLIGREVATLVDGEMPAGKHTVRYDGKNASSGIYFYRINSAHFTAVKRMVLMK